MQSDAQAIRQICQHAFTVSENVVIPVSNNLKTPLGEVLVAPGITRSVSVLTAINLDDELLFKAYEINNERAQWNLSSKLDVAEPTVAQQPPKRTLSIGHFVSQGLCIAVLSGGHGPMVRRIDH